MRIYYVSGSPLPSTEASGVNVMRMCDALAGLGHEVTVFARRNGAGGDASSVLRTYGIRNPVRLQLLSEAEGVFRHLRYAHAVRSALRTLPPPDLFYGRHADAMVAANLTWPAVPMAYEIHGITRGLLRRRLEHWLFGRPSFLSAFAISEALISDFRATHRRFAAADITLARDAAAVDLDPPALTQPLGGRPGARKVGYAGHLYPGKGMETVSALARRLPQHDFHVVGGKPDDLRKWRSRTAGLSNLVFHGYVEHVHVPAYLAAMDVLLAPPQAVTHSAAGRDIGRWMSPLKVFEYMAAARPIIASDIPAVREILRDGETALLAPPRDIEAWMAALQRLEDAALAQRLARAARADLLARFTWEARAEAVMRHLQQRLAGGKEGSGPVEA